MQTKQINTIKGLEWISDRYYIHSDGYILSQNKDGKSKIIKGYKNQKGYLFVILNRKALLISRLVALAFANNPECKTEVNHIDGNKLNNHITNLEWATRCENMQHAHVNHLINNARAISQFNMNGLFVKSYNSIKEAATLNNIDAANIHKVCNGKCKTAGGYIWRYEEDNYDIDPIKNRYGEKVVLQYDLHGKFLVRHKSITDAAKSVNGNKQAIFQVCLGKIKTCYGYVWGFEESSTTISRESTQ